MNYEKLWNNHKQWIENGIEYYKTTLDNFEDKNSDQYDNVSNVLATYEFHLDMIELAEKRDS